ncbi:uncharacterized protein [Oryctolagus cuniculus]|uniref:uncharacterized protein n=1 Tax=Oryctolagus cuniculus TaxID=9986 RepID=UPI003879E4B8
MGPSGYTNPAVSEAWARGGSRGLAGPGLGTERVFSPHGARSRGSPHPDARIRRPWAQCSALRRSGPVGLGVREPVGGARVSRGSASRAVGCVRVQPAVPGAGRGGPDAGPAPRRAACEAVARPRRAGRAAERGGRPPRPSARPCEAVGERSRPDGRRPRWRWEAGRRRRAGEPGWTRPGREDGSGEAAGAWPCGRCAPCSCPWPSPCESASCAQGRLPHAGRDIDLFGLRTCCECARHTLRGAFCDRCGLRADQESLREAEGVQGGAAPPAAARPQPGLCDRRCTWCQKTVRTERMKTSVRNGTGVVESLETPSPHRVT